MTQEALKLALDYLESRGLAWNVQIALREALREHAMREVQRLGQEIEQEPWCMKMNGCKTKCEDCPVEVAQRTWVGLTDEDKHLFSSWLDYQTDDYVFTSIEAKLKEKNT